MRILSPYAELLDLSVEPEADRFVMTMPFHEGLVGRPGHLHGGAIAGLLEFAAFFTLREAIGDERVTMKPVTVTVDYLRDGAERSTCAEAQVERLGRTIANVLARAWQDDRERPIAAARLNFLLDRPDR